MLDKYEAQPTTLTFIHPYGIIPHAWKLQGLFNQRFLVEMYHNKYISGVKPLVYYFSVYMFLYSKEVEELEESIYASTAIIHNRRGIVGTGHGHEVIGVWACSVR
jgi:hypothetical protein